MKRQSVYMEGLKKNIKEKCQTDSTYPLDLYNALGDYMVTNISANKFTSCCEREGRGRGIYFRNRRAG